ncbi:MAG: DUF1801 domain-containing protein [Pseudomonadota bacterium]
MTKITVDQYIQDAPAWQTELRELRKVLLSTPLEETIKWGMPCYTYQGTNLVGMSGFKSYFGLWFHQGALLADDAKVLINAQQGKTRALRQWRMTSKHDIQRAVIKRYVKESIANTEDGQKIAARKPTPLDVPDQLSKAMRRQKGAMAAFRDLRPSQQREYADYVRSAKRDDTKQRRIEKIVPMILAGKGLNDRYR